MPEAVFEYLFKYPRIAYERGEIVWSGTWSPVLMVLLFVGAAALIAWSYRSSRKRMSLAGTLALVGIRAAGVAILVVCLLRPTLVLSTAVPQQNVVAILLDDSRSMAIRDMDGRERGQVAGEIFTSSESRILREIEDRFMVRHFRFSSGTQRLQDPGQLTLQGTRTLIGPALDFSRRELSTLPLSGIVLVTDGGDQDPAALENALLGLRAEGIPVHVVGAGMERLSPDVAIERVELPRTVTRGSTVIAEVVVAHTGLGGRRVPVHIEEDGRILASEEVELASGGETTTVRIPVNLDASGVRTLRARVPVQPNEVVEENNHRDTHIQVRDSRDKILYYEGQPRFEVGFLRQAVREDENLQLVVLQRTGEDRYVRLDVDDGEELASGFPRTREELFEYRGLILGSVEASSFTPEQLRMIVDFVDVRGGGLLILGGPLALAEGGYANTALAPVFPLEIEAPASDPRGEVEFWATMDIRPTPTGLTHPALYLAGGNRDLGEDAGALEPPTDSETGWERLPALTTVNRLGAPRPGATVLLSGSSPDLPGGEQSVLSYQRYGAGTSAILSVHDTWLWQMHADIPLEDQTHQDFWKQLLRWLVQDVPEPLNVGVTRNRVAPEEPVELVARVVNEEYLPLNDARVTARVIDPFGAEQEIPLTWNLERDGEFRATFLPEIAGPYEVQVDALHGERFLTAPPLHVEAGVLDEELRSGAMRGNLLRRIAQETGGAFYTLDDLDRLPEALRYTDRGTVVQEERDLWDLPLFFFLLVGLLSAEWFLRRRGGLV